MRKNDLIIVGAGGLAREVLSWISELEKMQNSWKFIGCLSDFPDDLSKHGCDTPIIGAIAGHRVEKNSVYSVAIGAPDMRKKIVEQLQTGGARFVSLIHPTVIIGSRVQVGNGSIICQRVTLTCDISIGRFVLIDCHSTVGHDANIGDLVSLYSHADVTGGVVIGECAKIGSHVSLLPGMKVCGGATVGAGSVVVQNISTPKTYLGVPAKLLVL